MHFLCSYLRGDTEELITARRTIARWCNLSSIISWRSFSTRIFKRFPTHQHIVNSGLMTQAELEMFEATDAPYGKYWVPINWAGNLLHHLYERGFVDKWQLKQLIKELQSYKEGFGVLMCFDVRQHLVHLMTKILTISMGPFPVAQCSSGVYSSGDHSHLWLLHHLLVSSIQKISPHLCDWRNFPGLEDRNPQKTLTCMCQSSLFYRYEYRSENILVPTELGHLVSFLYGMVESW